MRVYFTSDELPQFRNPVVTVGSFDGVHTGHRALAERMRQVAQHNGGESVVVTFAPHPRQVITHKPTREHHQEDIKLLNTLAEKEFLLREAGIDNLVVVPFDLSVAGLSADEFVRDILVGKIGMKHFVVGFDHRFGHDRKGGLPYLTALGNELGFTVEEVARQEAATIGVVAESGSDYGSGSGKVSSTLIRRLIAAGEMTAAAKLLEHDYIIIGTRTGNEIVIGEKNKLLPPAGTYSIELYEAVPDSCEFSPRDNGSLTIDGCDRLYVNSAQTSAAVNDGSKTLIKIKSRNQKSESTGL